MNTGAQAGATQRKGEEGEGCLAYIGKLVGTAVGIIVVVVLGMFVVIYIGAGSKTTDAPPPPPSVAPKAQSPQTLAYEKSLQYVFAMTKAITGSLPDPGNYEWPSQNEAEIKKTGDSEYTVKMWLGEKGKQFSRSKQLFHVQVKDGEAKVTDIGSW